jgi:hypothetical protein
MGKSGGESIWMMKKMGGQTNGKHWMLRSRLPGRAVSLLDGICDPTVNAVIGMAIDGHRCLTPMGRKRTRRASGRNPNRL